MRIPSNKIDDVIAFFQEELKGRYSEYEIKSFVFQAFEYYTHRSKAKLLAEKSTGRLSESEILSLFNCIKDLRRYKPIQYIFGKMDWFEMQLHVNESVLIPRPETEELAQIISLEHQGQNPSVFWDVCTGSGCLALAMKKSFPEATVFGTDISDEALEIACENQKHNSLDVYFEKADIFDSQCYNKFPPPQIILSNPPYVTESQKSKMHKNVLDWEPHLALFVNDNDALIYYNAIRKLAELYLQEGGVIYLEINELLFFETAGIFEKSCFVNVRILNDFRGKPRFIVAVKQSC